MEASDCGIAPLFSALDAAELLELFGDDSSLFEMDEGISLLPVSESAVTLEPKPPPAPAAAEPRSPSLQFEPAIKTEESEPRSSREKPKAKSTYLRQKEELAYLHAQVAKLEARLRNLRGLDRQTKAATATETGTELEQSVREAVASSLSPWQTVAKHQQTGRLRAEKENAELQKLLKEHARLAKSLKKSLRKRLAPLKASLHPDQRQLTEVCEQDSDVFQVLLRNVEERLRSVDNMFETHGLTPATTRINSTKVVVSENNDQSVRAEIVNAKSMPFDFRLLSATTWSTLHMRQLRPERQNVSVLKFNDEVLVLKQVLPSSSLNPSARGSTVVFSVLRRVTQENRVLLLWERLVETNGAAAGSPTVYMSQYGCGQVLRIEGDNNFDGPPISLAQTVVHLAPVQMKSRAAPTSNALELATDLDAMIASYQQHRQNFLHHVENELESVIRDVKDVHI